MHVLVMSHMYPNKTAPVFGIFVHEQVKALIQKGIDITVISPRPFVLPGLKYISKKWKNYSEIPKIEMIEGIKVYHTKFFAIPSGLLKQYWGYGCYFFIKKLVKKINDKKKIDLIHVQSSSPDDYATVLLSKRMNIPYVLTAHGDSVLYLSRKKNRFKNSKIAIENANAVIAVSSLIYRKINELTNRVNNTFIILNGYKKLQNQPSSKSRSKGTIEILFAGFLGKRKGCEFLIKAMYEIRNRFNNVHLIIAGSGVMLQDYINLTNKLGIEDKVKFLGQLEHNEMLLKMNSCDIFALPSWDEAFGVVYLEAMSMKKPIIGTVGEGISDIVVDGENGLLVEPRSVNSIVEKLTLLIENKELRDKIAQNGYETAKKYTWNFNATKTLEVYEKVIEVKQRKN